MAVLRRASNVAHTAKSSRKLIDALSSLPSALDPRIQGILPVCDSRGSTQAPSILSRAEPSRACWLQRMPVKCAQLGNTAAKRTLKRTDAGRACSFIDSVLWNHKTPCPFKDRRGTLLLCKYALL